MQKYYHYYISSLLNLIFCMRLLNQKYCQKTDYNDNKEHQVSLLVYPDSIPIEENCCKRD